MRGGWGKEDRRKAEGMREKWDRIILRIVSMNYTESVNNKLKFLNFKNGCSKYETLKATDRGMELKYPIFPHM